MSNTKKITTQEVKQYVESQGYTLKSNYKKSNIKIKTICPRGHIYEVLFFKFRHRGDRCSQCSLRTTYKYGFVKQYIESKGYTLISNTYKNNRGQLKIQCEHGHIFHTHFDSFKNAGVRCSKCKSSKGENLVSQILKDLNLSFIEQKTFNNLIYIKKLRFDFYIPSLNMIIEYDGKQHYTPIKFFGGIDTFKKSVIRDNIKNEYCKENDINLLRIRYDNKDVYNTIVGFIANL